VSWRWWGEAAQRHAADTAPAVNSLLIAREPLMSRAKLAAEARCSAMRDPHRYARRMPPQDRVPGASEAQRYAFERVIGRGGGGWVALATDTQLGRQVAIKTVYGGTLDRHAVDRLRREGRVLAAARHPHVAKVFELLSDDSDVYVVMEYAPGGDLAAALREGRLRGSEVVRVLVDVADALELAAARDIVHRDVKPSNVLLTADGEARLADFGLARLPRSSGAFRTSDGSLSGTPAYMAPEQLSHPDLDAPQVDWFAFAAMAYEALTGSLPFPDRRFLELDDRVRAGPPSPSQVLPGLPTEVSDALLAGLDVDPTLRPSPREVADALLAVRAERWHQLVLPRSQPRAAPMTAGDETGRWPITSTDPPPALGFPFLPAQQFVDEPSVSAPPTVAPPVYVPPRAGLRQRLVGWRAPALVGAIVGVVLGVVIALVLH
jgi:serine/threonine protein kinase